MRNKSAMQRKEPDLCPLFQEECKRDECMLYHQQFGKCCVELLGYNMFKLSISLEKLQEKLKK